jgi:hypothetical protein
MKKNDIVKIRVGPASNAENHYFNGYNLVRNITAGELEEWWSFGDESDVDPDSDPPCVVHHNISLDDFMIVVRSNCSPELGQHKRSRMTKVQVISGKSIGCIGYVPKRHLEVTSWEG